MKRILSLLVSLLMTFTFFVGNSSQSFADNKPQLAAQYSILMDYETGDILFEKNSSDKLYPASTTKIWTAYVVLKNVSDLNEVIEVQDLPVIEGSSMYLKDGESFTVKQLLDAVLVHSSNDASYILAKHVSGSEEEFCKLMNKEAKAIGANNTNFTNPHGLPDDNHFTTAYDLALMSRKAMSNDVFRSIVKTPYIKFDAADENSIARYFKNTNKFISSKNETFNYKGKDTPIKYDIVDGIKTGTTDAAGRCLVSSAVKDNMRLISVVCKSDSTNLYIDSRTLLDYGFDNFYSTTIVNKEDYIKSERILFSKQKELIYAPEYSYKVVLPNGTKENSYTQQINLNDIDLPIKKGDKVGTLEIRNEKEVEHTINLVAKNEVNSVFGFITENKLIMSIIKILGIALLILLVIFIVLVIKKLLRKRK